MSTAALYRIALEADNAWDAELVRLYGKQAGDARYDSRGYSTPLLNQLMEAKLSADRNWRAEIEYCRKQ